jgi:maltose O-acetyltransferase
VKSNPWIWYRDLPAKAWTSYVLLLFPWIFAFKFFRDFYVRLALPHCREIFFNPGFRVYYGDRLFGNRIFLGNTLIMNYAPVTIGEGTTFSLDNKVLTGTHGIYDRNWTTAKPVTIGKNVWISTNCVILGGVSIGDNSIIGAGSVVSRDIPANCIATGNPCRLVKKLKPGGYVPFLFPHEPMPAPEKRGKAF